MEDKMEDKTKDISGKIGKVWDRKNQCWCLAKIESRSESRVPGMWKVTCYPPNRTQRIMENVGRQYIRLTGETIAPPETNCMKGGSYKKYKTKKRKTKKRKSKKRKSKKKNKNKNKTKRRR